jgi:folate-binding protein YgfZ
MSGDALGLRPAGAEVHEILRVEAGIPAPGHELDDGHNPLEAELRNAISFTKGCYTGQEVVARLNTYDKLQRALRGLRVYGEVVPEPGRRVLAGGNEAGKVTSAVRSPGLGDGILALAYLELEYGEPGTRLSIEIGDQEGAGIEAQVLAPPFVEDKL